MPQSTCAASTHHLEQLPLTPGPDTDEPERTAPNPSTRVALKCTGGELSPLLTYTRGFPRQYEA